MELPKTFNSSSLRLAALACSALLATSAHANLVTNGGFEAGDLTGWTVDPAGSLSVGAISDRLEHSGQWYVRFGAPSAIDTISQSLATTAGATYTVSFWLRNSGGAPNEFQFNWDGDAVEQDLVNSASFSYTNFSFDLVASSALTTISFVAFQTPAFYRLDDVSVELLRAPDPAGLPEPALLALVGPAGALAGAGRFRKST